MRSSSSSSSSSSIFQNLHQSKQSLPLSQPDSREIEASAGIRRRLSSLSLRNLQTCSSNAASSSWDLLRRSKSVSSVSDYAGGSVRKWWDWGLAWILSRKPSFAQDLEMNEEEIAALGCHNKGSLRHVFFKLSSEIKRLMGSANSDAVKAKVVGRYDSFNYFKNRTNLIPH